MTVLLIGLLLFLGVHSVRIVADDWRGRQIARLGAGAWKAMVSIVSALGLALIVWGYGQARALPTDVFGPPDWTRPIASLLAAVSFVLIAAAYVPGNRIKAKLGHPMVAGVKVWAFAHLIANGRLADVLLFGAFLAWAIVDFAAARRRDHAQSRTYPPGTLTGDVIAAVAGLLGWLLFAMYLHAWLIGVRPFG